MKFNKTKSIVSKILIVVAVALLYFGAVWYYRRTQTEVVQNPETNIPVSSDGESEISGQFKNGTYNAVGTYISPGGAERVNVTLTIFEDTITGAEVTAQATVPTSEFFQEDFIANYKTQVIGKSIAELQLTKVSGSSLTPKGFNDAVAKIKTQARL